MSLSSSFAPTSLDAFTVGYALPTFPIYLMKRSLFFVPFFGWGVYAAGHVPVATATAKARVVEKSITIEPTMESSASTIRAKRPSSSAGWAVPTASSGPGRRAWTS